MTHELFVVVHDRDRRGPVGQRLGGARSFVGMDMTDMGCHVGATHNLFKRGPPLFPTARTRSARSARCRRNTWDTLATEL